MKKLFTMFLMVFLIATWANGQMQIKSSSDQELMRITETGLVGIGTTAPLEKFHVNGDIALGDHLGKGTDQEIYVVQRPDEGRGYDLTIRAGKGRGVSSANIGGNVIIQGGRTGDTMPPYTHGHVILQPTNLDWTGRVGIGTTNPLERLDVNGAIRLANTSNVSPGNEGTIRFTGEDFEGYLKGSWVSLTHGSGATCLWSQNGTSIYYNTGNVGIGTTLPPQKLSVVSNATNQFGIYKEYNPPFYRRGAQFFINANNDLQIFARDEYQETLTPKNILLTEPDMDGRVGIGILHPLAKLDVVDPLPSGDGNLFSVREATPGYPFPIVHNRFMVFDGGNVAVGGSTAPFKLTVQGQVMLQEIKEYPLYQSGYAGIYTVGGELFALDQSGNSTQLSPHNAETGEWIFFSKNLKTGRVVKVNMEKLVKKIETLTGEKFMEEFVDGE